MTRRRVRGAAAGLSVVGLAVYGWLVIEVYRRQADPEAFVTDGGAPSVLGPPADALARAADEHLDRGVDVLNDTSLPAAERLASYREELRAAERSLVASLRTRPTQALALARLAAVRWELNPPLTDDATRPYLELIEQAGRMAPTWAEVQGDLAVLLWKMQRPDESLRRFRLAAELRPSMTRELVERMREVGVTPERIRQSLPGRPEHLVALRPIYLENGLEIDYIERIEPLLSEASPLLLAAYAAAHRHMGDLGRLDRKLSELTPYSEPALEARRMFHRSQARASTGRLEEALVDARTAAELDPPVAYLWENIGRIELALGRPEAAREGFRTGLAAAAARSVPNPAFRARLYRQVGETWEAQRQMDRAYDAYQRAIELDPGEPVATRRLREMREAAGAGPR